MEGRRRRTLRILFIAAGALVGAGALLVGGFYIWLAITMSQANSRPGVAEAKRALQEPVLTRTTYPSLPSDSSQTATSTAVATSSTASTASTAPPPEAPGTMNILLLGADKREGSDEAYGRSDTMMLVHVDPNEGFLSLLSFPRDLRVYLAGYGTQKLNAAYALGGDALAIRTIRDLTGLKIDHYAKVGFQAFQALVDHFGGVYLDVDRRYYDGGDILLPIDLEPGYQRLDGESALRYVRTRHDWDHDWARIQRQQQFLRAVKEQVLTWDMALRLPSGVNTLMAYLTTDMGANDVLRLAWWAAHMDLSRVKQVTLSGTDQIIDGVAYVLSTDSQIQAALDGLLTPPDIVSAAPIDPTEPLPARDAELDLAGITVEVRDAGAGAERVAAIADYLGANGASVAVAEPTGESRQESAVVYAAQMERSLADEAGLISLATRATRMLEENDLRRVVLLAGADLPLPDPAADLLALEEVRRQFLARESGFPLRMPTWLPPGYSFAGSRVYYIAGPHEDKLAVRVTYKLEGTEQYLGFTCTRFLDAPAAAPGRRYVVDGRTFTAVGPSGRPERIWWVSDGLLYWVSNTLGSVLTERELLGVSSSCFTGP